MNRFFFNKPKNFFTTATKSKKLTKTYYQILQLSNNASQKEIKENFLKLAKIYHPDVYKGSDKDRFNKIKEAYQTLKNIEKRKKYDIENGFIKQEKRQEPQIQQPQLKNDFNTQKEKSKKVNLDYSFDKTEAIQDIDEEYQKFFGKKIKTPFEEIRIFEEPQFKQMTQEERVRRKFKQIFNQPIFHLKTYHQQTFDNILNSQINQRNEYVKENQQQIKEQQYQKTQQFKKKTLRKLYRRYAVFGMIFFPLLISAVTRWRIHKQQDLEIIENVSKIENEIELDSINQRIKF